MQIKEVMSESVMLGLMLFSIVLMISEPEITGFSILSLPVYVNFPLILGVIIFVVDLIIIERYFKR